MNTKHDLLDLDHYGLCDGVQKRVHIEISTNGYSICRSDYLMVEEYLFEGIQDLDVAHELTEMLTGELEHQAIEAQQNPCLVFG
ncbi:MAG: hypothetical protein H7839_19155 [Magnetococcus sp. YQC-5]